MSAKGDVVRCGACGDPIESRADLAVSGQILIPRHRRCYATGPILVRMRQGWPINGRAFWPAWAVGSVFLLWAAMALPRPHLFIVFVAFEVGLLVPRLVSWLAYERKLPRAVVASRRR